MQSSALIKYEASVDRPLHLGIFGSTSLWLWLDRGALRIGTILAGLVLIRYLGPANYGIYVTSIAAGSIVNIITDFGLTRYGARTAAAMPEEIPRILASSLFVTASCFVLELAVFVVSLVLGQTYPAAFAAGLMLTNFEGTSTLCSALLTGALRARAILPASILSVCGTVAIVLIAVWQRFPVLTLLSALAVKSLIVLGVRLLQMQGWWPHPGSITFKEIVATIRRAWPYFSYAVAEIAYSQMPVLCLGMVAGRVQVGLFAAAMVIANIFPQWLFASSDALLPIITRLYEAGETLRTAVMMQRITDLFVISTVPVAITLSALAPMIGTLMGGQFRSSAGILRIAAFNCILTAIGTLLGSVYLTASNRVRDRRNVFAVCVVGTVALVLVLGGIYGGAGAAVAVIVGNLAIDVAYMYLCRTAGLTLALTPTLIPVFAGAVALAIEFGTQRFFPSPAGSGAIAVLAYAGILFLVSRQTIRAAWATVLECANLRSQV